MSPSSPEAKPAQPKDAQDQSGAKDIVPSSGEQEKKADNGATAKVEASDPVTSSKVAPVSTPPLSEKPPIVPSDSTPAPTSPGSPDPEKRQDTTVPVFVPTTSVEPALRAPDAPDRLRKRKLLIVHTRLARFFTWILLLAFVILPSTFSRDHQDSASQGITNSQGGGNAGSSSPLRHIYNLSLFAVAYSCCLINGLAICWLWYIRKDDHQWLLTNLFSAGLINSFSGLITTFVNYCGVQGGKIGVSTKATLVLTSCSTFIYAVLTVVYARKRQLSRYRRGSRASSAMV